MNSYSLNSSVRLKVRFTDPVTGAPIAVTSCQLSIVKPDGTVVSKTEANLTELLNDGDGYWHYDTILDQVGYWNYRFTGQNTDYDAEPDGARLYVRIPTTKK